jgi:hypothetical protein
MTLVFNPICHVKFKYIRPRQIRRQTRISHTAETILFSFLAVFYQFVIFYVFIKADLRCPWDESKSRILIFVYQANKCHTWWSNNKNQMLKAKLDRKICVAHPRHRSPEALIWHREICNSVKFGTLLTWCNRVFNGRNFDDKIEISNYYWWHLEMMLSLNWGANDRDEMRDHKVNWGSCGAIELCN